MNAYLQNTEEEANAKTPRRKGAKKKEICDFFFASWRLCAFAFLPRFPSC
jgi:hypothetical protein